MHNIKTAFQEYFEILEADSIELRKIAFNLRFQVLCMHNTIPGFDPKNYPDEQESDEYDSHSIHLLLRHRPSDTFIGTTRLILPNPKSPEDKFPTELYTCFYPEFSLTPSMRCKTAEISRFVILNTFFKRKGEKGILTDPVSTINQIRERRHFPHPMLGLVTGIMQFSARYNICHLISSMDPALNKLLRFYGLQLEPIGPAADYHGPRCPYYGNIHKTLDKMRDKHRAIWELVTSDGKIQPENSVHLQQQDQPVPISSIC